MPSLYKSMVNHSKKRWANDVKNNPMQAQKRIIKSSVGFDLLEDDVFYKSFLGEPVFKEPELMRRVFIFNSKKDVCTNATVVCSASSKGRNKNNKTLKIQNFFICLFIAHPSF